MVYRTLQIRPENRIQNLILAAGALPALEVPGPEFVISSIGWIQASVAFAGQLVLAVPSLPASGKIRNVSVEILGFTGHVALPATMPTLQLIRANPDSTVTLLGAAVDPSATVAEYQVAHQIEIPNINFDLASVYESIYFVFRGETGANSIAGIRVFKFKLLIE